MFDCGPLLGCTLGSGPTFFLVCYSLGPLLCPIFFHVFLFLLAPVFVADVFFGEL
ncbi:hypothetical protein HN873_031589, partial [Arachis hypogaea]